MNVLYLCYDGLTDHIAQSQVLPYVMGLQARGFRFSIVSHEKPGQDLTRTRKRLEDAGVHWFPQRYYQGSIARTLPRHIAAQLAGSVRARLDHGTPRIVHARSYVAASAAAIQTRFLAPKFIFDMRGFWLDEKIDTGRWQPGPVHAFGKRIERPLFGAADGIVSLTAAGRDELRRWPNIAPDVPIAVIPTAVDVDRFAPRGHPARKGLTIGYLGSLGARYLPREMARMFVAIRSLRPDARLRVLTGSDVGELSTALEAAGVDRSAWDHKSVPHADVPRELHAFSATLCLIKPSYATSATCPTKVGESLAAGLPVVVNVGVGDAPILLPKDRAGVVVDVERPAGYAEAAAKLLELIADPATSERCMRLARSHFALGIALDRYEHLYHQVLSR